MMQINLSNKIFPFRKTYDLNLEINIEGYFQGQEILDSIILEFFNRKNKRLLSSKSIKIIVPRDFNDTYYRYSNPTIQEYIDKNGFPDDNGVFILPLDIEATNYVLLIKEFVLKDKYEIYKTLFHEFTHIIDFTSYFNKNGNIYIKDIDTKIENFYFEFYLWTEFNAKRIGLTRLKKELDRNNHKIDLAQTALNFQNDVLSSPPEIEIYYGLSHFLARISVYEHQGLSSNEFPSNWLSTFFEIDILKLYNKLKKIKDFKDFDKNKKRLRDLFGLKKQKNYLC